MREALHRISEGAVMIRTKGEAGTGDISQAVKHYSTIKSELQGMCKNIKNSPLNHAYTCTHDSHKRCYIPPPTPPPSLHSQRILEETRGRLGAVSRDAARYKKMLEDLIVQVCECKCECAGV